MPALSFGCRCNLLKPARVCPFPRRWRIEPAFGRVPEHLHRLAINVWEGGLRRLYVESTFFVYSHRSDYVVFHCDCDQRVMGGLPAISACPYHRATDQRKRACRLVCELEPFLGWTKAYISSHGIATLPGQGSGGGRPAVEFNVLMKRLTAWRLRRSCCSICAFGADAGKQRDKEMRLRRTQTFPRASPVRPDGRRRRGAGLCGGGLDSHRMEQACLQVPWPDGSEKWVERWF